MPALQSFRITPPLDYGSVSRDSNHHPYSYQNQSEDDRSPSSFQWHDQHTPPPYSDNTKSEYKQHSQFGDQHTAPSTAQWSDHRVRACATASSLANQVQRGNITASRPHSNGDAITSLLEDPISTDISPCSTPPLSHSERNFHFEMSSSASPASPFPPRRPRSSEPEYEYGNMPAGYQHQQHQHQYQQPVSGYYVSHQNIKRERDQNSTLGSPSYAQSQSQQQQPARPRRITGACSRCRRLKMKCEFKENAPACSRCTIGKHECVQEERKPRNPGERDRILQKLRYKEAQVQSLIESIKEDNNQATPLNFIPTKLNNLTEQQKDHFRPVLLNAANTRRPNPSQLNDIRSILDAEDWTSSGSEESSSGSSDNVEVSSDDGNTPVRHFRKGSDEDGLPSRMAPLGLIARISLEEQSSNASFFRPGPMADQDLRAIMLERGESAPNILIHGLFSFDDIEILFEIFYDKIYPTVGMLDPDIHTPSAVLVRCPFLFTVMCAIASRFLPFHHLRQETPDLYPLAMHYAKTAAASALIDGRKSIETCQAFLLMCLWAPKGKRYEEDRTWFYSGVAMRLATDLDLHKISERPSKTDERSVREWNNRVRTWSALFNLDRSLASQFGKPCALTEDVHVKNMNWYRSPFATNFDIHSVAYTGLLRIMARFKDSISHDDLTSQSLSATIESFEQEINAFSADLDERYEKENDHEDHGARFRAGMKPFTINHFYLTMLSHNLQRSFDEGVAPDAFVLMKALHAATTVLKTFLGSIAESGLLRYLPDCYFIYAGFSAIFLLKLIDPKSTKLLDHDQTERILELVSTLVYTLSSPDVAIDESHTPRLYAGFLSGLLDRVSRGYVPQPSTTAPSTASSSTSSSSWHSTDFDNYDIQQTVRQSHPSQPMTTSYVDPTYVAQGFAMEPTTWEHVYDSPMVEYDHTQQVGASWTYSDGRWNIQNMCPNMSDLAPGDNETTPYIQQHPARNEYF